MEGNKYLRLAREARAENNSESAKMYYQKVREEDPESGEAKFFYAYYLLYAGTNGELPRRFVDLCKGVGGALSLVKHADMSKQEQLETIETIADAFVPETWANNVYMNEKNRENKVGSEYVQIFSLSDLKTCARTGMLAIRDFGNTVVDLYPGDAEAKRIAVKAWKEYVSLAQKLYAYAPKGEAEIYAAKIKEVEPSYTMPKKAGCISFANSKK